MYTAESHHSAAPDPAAAAPHFPPLPQLLASHAATLAQLLSHHCNRVAHLCTLLLSTTASSATTTYSLHAPSGSTESHAALRLSTQHASFFALNIFLHSLELCSQPAGHHNV
jgi:hypothetical protein